MREFLPEGWSVKKSSDYCLRVADGTHDTPKPAEVGRPLITSKNLDNGRIAYDGAYLISETDYLQINKRSKVDRWDVLFSMIGTVGEIALVRTEPNFAIKNIGLFKSKTKEDGIWLYYYLTSSVGQAALDTFLSGTSQQFVALGDLRKVQVIVPSEKSKSKIAAILSAYDELIENNHRRIVLLEKMAEEIYREWFVRLRFPGHEKVKIIKGVPEEWQIKRVSDIVDRKRFGRIYREAELTPEGAIVVIDQSINECLGFHDGKAEHDATIEQPLILFGDHSCKMQLMIKPFSLAENVIPFSSKSGIPIVFLYYLVHSLVETTEYKRHWTELTSKQVFVPTKKLQEQFDEKVRYLIVAARQLKLVNSKLSKSRDLLLGRLISGKLSVENLDIQFPPGMAEDAHA